jgi:uncharacterized membrane protein YqgA involved in biofilm formation
MLATIINAVVVVLGGLLGLALGGRLQQNHTRTIVSGLGICTLVIGISSALETANILTVIICIVLGTIIGQLLKLEARMESLGDWLKARVARKGSSSRFTEGFVTASLLYCVGSMAIMGSLSAGISGDFSILLSKSALDCVMSVPFAATMGVGVLFAAGPVLVYQGIITLLATWAEPFLSTAVVAEMTAVGGIMLIGTGLNMLNLPKERIAVGNMLPAILLPILYLPVSNWIAGILA